MVAQRNEQLFFWGLLLHPKLFLGLPDPPPGLIKPRSWVSVHWPSAPTSASHTVRGQMGGKLGASSPLVWEAVRSKRRKSESRPGLVAQGARATWSAGLSAAVEAPLLAVGASSRGSSPCGPWCTHKGHLTKKGAALGRAQARGAAAAPSSQPLTSAPPGGGSSARGTCAESREGVHVSPSKDAGAL